MKEIISATLTIIFVLVMALLFGRFLVATQENTVWRNDNYCKQVYNATDASSEEFFGRFCAEPNYTSHTITKHYYTHAEMMDYCGRIGFWQLNKWKDRCS